MKKRIPALIASLLMATNLTACLGEDDTSYDGPDDEISSEAASAPGSRDGTGKTLSPSDAPSSTGKRHTRSAVKPMGEDGTWTIFVYMCGSDLESDGGMATADIEEMTDSSANENVRFVIQTGGASQWYNGVDAGATERYVIENGKAECVYTGSAGNMGDSSHLSDFLSWGVSEYPAARMGVIFWDHGGGSISGVCFDETVAADSEALPDSLYIKEIDAALYSVYDKMTSPFEFIGFDACLMATAETAAMLSNHALYMVGSEESEPGEGWDYTVIGDTIASDPTIDGAALGRVICDSFYESCAETGTENGVTLSVIDLNKMGNVLTGFDAYSKELYDLICSGGYAPVARKISSADNFGGNNRSEGYTNMVDMGGLIDAGADLCPSAQDAKSALAGAVVYTKNGSDHRAASGLSMYYPLQLEGSAELKIFKDIAISPYYLALVDKVAYGASSSGNISGYDNIGRIDSYDVDYDGEDYGDDYTYSVDDTDDTYSYADSFTPGENCDVTFLSEPAFDSNGYYSFRLSEDSLDNTDYVEAFVYGYIEEENTVYSLGSTTEVDQDWDSGVFTDSFDGRWFSLPDGQNLAVFPSELCEGYDIYAASVLVNGKEKSLRFAYYYDTGKTEIIDICDPISESGAVGRKGTKLSAGDVIEPVYDAFSLDREDDEFVYTGDKYVYNEGDRIIYSDIYEGMYFYSFCINDIYGNYYDTDIVAFRYENGEVLFDDGTGEAGYDDGYDDGYDEYDDYDDYGDDYDGYDDDYDDYDDYDY